MSQARDKMNSGSAGDSDTMGTTSTAGAGSDSTGTGSNQAGLDGVRQRVRETADHAREVIRDKVGTLGEQMGGISGNMTEQFDRIRHMNRDDYEEVWTGVKERARQNPGQTILVSAAVGFVLGMMMRMGGGRRY